MTVHLGPYLMPFYSCLFNALFYQSVIQQYSLQVVMQAST
jgi:hypothetical protein